MEESEVLKTLQCGFESHQTHQKIYKEPSKDDLIKAIKTSYNYTEVLQKLELDANNNNHRRKIYSLIKYYELDTSNLEKKRNPSNQARSFDPKNPLKTLFTKKSRATSGTVKRYLFKLGLKETCCEKCKIETWNNQIISLELHHLDGDNTNHSLQNLQILCPNCHSQTENYKVNNVKFRL